MLGPDRLGAGTAGDENARRVQWAAVVVGCVVRQGWCEMGGFGGGSRVRFVGRSAELDALRLVLDGVAQGPAWMGLVEGEPGIGKSRLLAESAPVRSRARVSGPCGRLR